MMASTNGDSHAEDYSVPLAAAAIYQQGILSHPLIAKDLPPEVQQSLTKINFVGSNIPSLPVNWRLAEAASPLKALEASLVDVILQRRFACPPHQVTINTDHASLFLFSTLLWTIDRDGENISASSLRQADPKLFKYFPSGDKHRMNASIHRNLATNIYKCADRRFFHAHGSLNPTPTLLNIGLPPERDVQSYDEGMRVFQEAFSEMDSETIQKITDETKQAGSICYSVDEFRASEHGRANEHVGLWEIREFANSTQRACWWPHVERKGSASASASRPLAGLKVVDLTRIIAGPCITRSLAELGASVMRCTAPHLPDVVSLQADLNWGKWNSTLDLREEADRVKLTRLIEEADVVVQGYRPGSLDKFGFGEQDILNMCHHRSYGVVHVRENYYGWHGPWKDRSGWQQIADACTGLSYSFGQAMGHGDPVTPVYPHCDYCTGIAGSCAVLIALQRRAEKGGSYCIDLALNYYSSWLIKSVGTYPLAVWDRLWAEHGKVVYQYWHNNGITAPEVLRRMRAGPGGERVLKPEFFEDRASPYVLGEKKFHCVKGVADWGGAVRLGYNVGTRGNGVDDARWPDDLMQEVVLPL